MSRPITLRINEIFFSIQGETSRIGLPTVFIRLTGCPLRCGYCDSEYAFYGGNTQNLADILQQVASRHANVRVWDPIARFCDAQTCYAAAAGVVRYQDQNHLTASMSRTLQAEFAPLFSWARQP